MAEQQPIERAGNESEPDRKRRSFGVNKIGLAIIAVLVVGLVAWHAGVSLDPSSVGRDAGGFAGNTSYGGGGGDYGGGYGGGYDGGSSFYVFDWDWDDDYDYDYDYSSSYEEYSWVDAVIAIIVLLIILSPGFGFSAFGSGGSSKQDKRAQPEGASPTPSSKLLSIDKLQERDPSFSPVVVEEMIADVYVQMQHAWTAGDFEPMRPYFTNTLFSQFSNQLSNLTKQGKVNYVDNIAVLETTIRGWYESQRYEYLVMKVRSRITDYTLDKSGKLVSGYTDAESFMEYEYTLRRPRGTKTVVQGTQTRVDECPNCGAPINLAQSTRCEYCGSVIESKDFPWVISEIKGISQQIQR